MNMDESLLWGKTQRHEAKKIETPLLEQHLGLPVCSIDAGVDGPGCPFLL